MQIYRNLMILGIIGVLLSVSLPMQIMGNTPPLVAIFMAYLVYAISLFLTFLLTKKELDKRHADEIESLKKKQAMKISRIKREHDTITLEKTIRDGTQTLIKNALDYFKIENIKNEMGSTAAIENLQLDKYGQIIELLADFSLILPDYQANQEIVRKEITHQIDIYQNDEQTFALFLQRIMEKYLLTLNKKLKERTDLNQGGMDRRCPGCHNRIHPQARICPHCGQHLGNGKPVKGGDWQQKGFDHYQMGNYHEALRVFSIFIDLNPNADQAYYNRGVVYYRLNKHAEAMEDFKRAAQLGNTKAQNALQILRNLDTQEMTPYSPPSA